MKTLFTLFVLLLCSGCASKESQTAPMDTFDIKESLSVQHSCDMEWILRYEQKYIKALKERAATEPAECDVMFFGSSSIRLWKSLKEDFAPLTVVNRGYGGATLRDLLYNYNAVMAHYRPKAFVIYCDNDLKTKASVNISVGELFDLYRVLFDRLERDYPGAPVYFLAVKHSKRREAIRDRQMVFNAVMKEYADLSPQVTFVDTCTPLLTADGQIDTTLFLEDNIHLNDKGYKRWVDVVKPLLIK